MKRLLVTTLFIFSCVSYGVARVKVRINGSVDSHIVNVTEKIKEEKKAHKKVHSNEIITDAYLKFHINGINSDLKYGGMIKLNANTSKSKKEILSNSESKFIEQMMVYLEGRYGHVEVGSYTGISNAMKVDASTFASATGGINSNSMYIASSYNRMFLQTPNLPTNELGTVGINEINATKINYYTPEFSGFRIGISYIPDLKVHDNTESANTVYSNGFKNIIEAGLSYIGEVKNIGVKLATVGEFGRNKQHHNKKLNAWNTGINISYQGFIIGASYGKNKHNVLRASSHQYTNQYAKTNYWTTGIGYEYGPISTSITHLQSKMDIVMNKKANTFRNTVFGIDYKIASGLLSYLEFASFKMRNRPDADMKKSNQGHIFIMGINLKF